MPFVAGGDEGGILHHLYKGPDAMPRGTLGGTSGPLMIERPISAVQAIACGAALSSSETADSGKVPAIVTENMPGAGSFAGFPLDSAVGGSGKTNAAEFHYVGRVNTSAWSWSTGRLWRPMAEKGQSSAFADPSSSGRSAPIAALCRSGGRLTSVGKIELLMGLASHRLLWHARLRASPHIG